MQRIFTVFPGGAPGLALVLLRLGVTGSLWQPVLHSGLATSAVRLFGLGTASALLLFGFATPLVSLVTSVIQLVRMLDPLRAGTLPCMETAVLAIHVLSALSLALIGPGAFSVDARLFGRRILTSS